MRRKRRRDRLYACCFRSSAFPSPCGGSLFSYIYIIILFKEHIFDFEAEREGRRHDRLKSGVRGVNWDKGAWCSTLFTRTVWKRVRIRSMRATFHERYINNQFQDTWPIGCQHCGQNSRDLWFWGDKIVECRFPSVPECSKTPLVEFWSIGSPLEALKRFKPILHNFPQSGSDPCSTQETN